MKILSKRAARQVEWVQKWPAFRRATRVLELGAGSFETLAWLAEKHPRKQFYGIDFVLQPAALAVAEYGLENLRVSKHDVRDLSLFPDDSFDFVFSVALVEHIHELDIHLSGVHRVLRDGGHYCFMAAPLWSSSLGHHCDHNAPDCPIPLYGHLYMTRENLGNWIVEQVGKSREESAGILRRVYDRQDLGRLNRSKIRQLVERSPLQIDSWKEGRDKNFNSSHLDAVLRNNLYNVSPNDLKVSSIVCSLAKGRNEQSMLSRLRNLFARMRAPDVRREK